MAGALSSRVFLTYAALKFSQKISRERGNILLPLSKRRHEKEYVEAMKRSCRNAPRVISCSKVCIGCRDHARIDGDRLAGTYRLKALFFEHAQHFRLRPQAHVADFVQKKSTAVGLLKFSDLVLRGAVETDMPEEFGLDQFFRNCGAIYLHERSLTAGLAA